MLIKLTIKARLIFFFGFLCQLSIGIGSAGLVTLGATNDSVKTLYEDRVVALRQLNTVLTQIQQNQITLATALADDPERVRRRRR